jgi:type IV pilus assembly protein PilY1
MNVARHSKRLLAALMASAITVVDVHAAVTDIYTQPLATTSTVVAKPNVMFILDNSGSMQSDFMPDDMDDSGRYGFHSSQCNGVAFDASAAYPAPIKADGTTYPDVNFNAAPPDGYVGIVSRASSSTISVGTGSQTANIPSAGNTDYAVGDRVVITSQTDPTVWMSGTVTGWNASNSKNLVVNVTGTSSGGTFSSWNVGLAADLTNSTYYRYTGSQTRMNWTYSSAGSVQTGTTFYSECRSTIGSSPGSGVFTAVTLTNGSATADKQKYANWYSYYRTRRLMTRTATGRAFSGLTNAFRVGFTTISDTGVTNGTNKFVDVGDFDAAKKTAFYNSLYTATGSSNTPLRGA